MIKKIVLLAALSALWLNWSALAFTLTYKTTTGDLVSEATCSILQAPDSITIVLEWHERAQHLFSTVVTDAAWSATRWRYINKEEGSELTAVRQNGSIVLSGVYKKKPIKKIFPAGDMPWKEAFPYDMSAFAMGTQTKVKFIGIGLEGRSAMRLGKFVATKVGTETITVNSQKTEAIHVRIALAGVLSVFWHGDYWFRKNDGRVVKGISNEQGSLPIISELIKEN